MIRSLRKLWARPWADWGLLASAVVLTIAVRGSLAVFSLRAVTQKLRSLAARFRSRHAVDPIYRKRVTWAANAVGFRILPKRPCLTQALVAQFLLRLRGDTTTTMHIGVAKGDEGELLAHAWLEHAGRVIIGGTASPYRYKRFRGLKEGFDVERQRE